MTSACGDRRGTRTGYNRHRRAKQPACDDCQQAEARHKTPSPKKPPDCGTEAGWARHRRRREDCDQCRRAAVTLDAARKKIKRANTPPRHAEPIIHVPRKVFARLYLNAAIADQMFAEQFIPEPRIRRCVQEHNLAS